MRPYHTLEVRWFWRGDAGAVGAWFSDLGPPVASESRTDRYLGPTSDDLGVKLREGRVEAKRREGAEGTLPGRPETVAAWAKWSFPILGRPIPDGGWVEVAKTRRQRAVHLAGAACALELSGLQVEGETWGSLCLEAHGPTPAARREALDEAVRQWLADPPPLGDALASGYPAWLRAR